MSGASLSLLDLAIIAAYLLFSVGLGVWLGRQNQTSDDYFLARRQMSWWVIGGSLYASNISTTTLVGLCGAAYTYGIVFYNYEWMAVVVLILFSFFFVRVILRVRIYTIPEYFERRFSRTTGVYLSILTLFLNIVVDTAGSLYAGALIFSMVWPDVPLWQIISGLALVSGAYTIVGGLAAVMITDVIQAIILTATSTVVAIAAFLQAGGWSSVMDAASAKDAATLHLFHPINDATMPWPALILSLPILGFYFWCTNQFMVQRVLAARTDGDGQHGMLFAGLLKLPTLVIMVLPGIAAIALYPNLDNGDTVYARLIFDLLPSGLLGLALVGFVAALMSQIDSTLNSASTIITMDFVHRAFPKLSSSQLMRVGQVCTLIFMLLAMAWAPQIERFRSVFQYLQDILAFAVGPVVALFWGAMLWPRANRHGAHAAIGIGLAVSTVLFIARVQGTLPFHTLYAAPLTAAASGVALVTTSLLTAAESSDPSAMFSLADYSKETDSLRNTSIWKNYRWQSLGLLGVTAMIVYIWR